MTWSRPARWLLLSGLGIIAATFAGPRVVPLYDGLGFPDQPYQYAGRSDNSAPPAQSAQVTVSKADLDNTGVALTTAESGPQFKLVFGPGTLRLSNSATSLQLSAIPETPSSQPSSGSISSNVYKVSTTAGTNTVVVHGPGDIYLRLPQNVSFTSPPTMIFRAPGGSWQQIQTTQTGADIYKGAFSSWGEYALAVNMHSQASGTTGAGKHSHNPALLVAALVIALIAIILIAIRLRGPAKA